MEDKKPKILYVDDEAHNLLAFKALFRRSYDVYTAQSAEDGRALLAAHTFQIILTDQRMPDITGVEFLETIIPDFPDPIRMLITGYADIQAVINAINKGQVYRYISKPWDEQELSVTLGNATELYALRQANKQLTEKLLIANQQLDFMLRNKLHS